MILNHKRQDYETLLYVTNLLISPSNEIAEIKINKPGSFTHSRWMQKLTISIMIYLYRDQLNKKNSSINKLKKFIKFGIKVYIKLWFDCNSAERAAYNDLFFCKTMLNYDDKLISSTCIKSFNRHSQYLTDELLALALFDSNINLDEKRLMIYNLNYGLIVTSN